MQHTVTTTERGGWEATTSETVVWTAELVSGLLDATPRLIPDLFGNLGVSNRRLVVMDETVHRIYGDRIVALLKRYGVEHPLPVLIPGGEQSKTRPVVDEITAAMERWGVNRFDEPVLVWGGGVLHDVAGMAAAEYRRGVPYRMYGTTLVCAIDAGFAAKVAISDRWKNRTGHYYPPEAMFTDLAILARDRSQILDGTGEILKWALVDPDPETFDDFARFGPDVVRAGFPPGDPAAERIVRRTIAGMLDELAGNLRERRSERRSYIGHGMCPCWEPQVSHGQAVTLDILLTLMIATRRRVIPATLRDHVVGVVRDVGLALWHDVLDQGPGPIMRALHDTARHRHGQQSIPVMDGEIGRIHYMQDITAAEVSTALDDLRQFAHTA